MAQQYTFYVPILGGPNRSIIRKTLISRNTKLWFKCKGLPVNRWMRLTVTGIQMSPGNGCHIICVGTFLFPRTLITDNRHVFTLRPFEEYEFDIKYRPDLRTGRVSSIGRPATKNPPQ